MTLWGIHSATKAAIVQDSQGHFALNSLLYSSVFKHGDGRSVDPTYTMVLISLAEGKIMDPGCCLDVPLSHIVLMSAVSYYVVNAPFCGALFNGCLTDISV